MNNHHEVNNADDIDLKELLLALWRGKVYLLLSVLLFIGLGSWHLQNQERKYLVQYKLKPVGETKQNTSLSGLGGFASIAGVKLPPSDSNGFMIFKELIHSVEVSEIIFKDKKLMKKIFESEWNSSLNSFYEPPKSKRSVYIGILKEILTGYKPNYTLPGPRRLAIFIAREVQLKGDKDTGFLSISSETSKPDIMLSIISGAIEASDKIMRQRYIKFSKEPLDFYKEKIRTSRSREHREALAGLIGKEEQKLMLASKGKYFTAEPYIAPTISLYPVFPKPKLVLLVSLILGLIMGSSIIFLRSLIVRNEK